MKGNILFAGILVFSSNVSAQKFLVEKSTVTFFSNAAIENIAAENSKSNSIFNETTGEIVFSIPVTEFEFAKSLMKEHFNEKYLETEKYLKSTFQGKIAGYQTGVNGVQQVRASGKLTIHGVTKDIDTRGTMEKANGKIVIKSSFIVKLEDYMIKIPQVLWQNIAKEVEVKVEFLYRPL